MRGFLAVLRKELRSYFISPVAWVFVAGFLLLVGVYYSSFLEMFFRQYMFSQQGMGEQVDVNQILRDYTIQYILTIFLFFVPLLTMRLIAAEKRARTDELLFTSPVSTFSIVLGKWAAALAVLGVGLAVTLYVPLCTATLGELDWAPVALGYAGIVLFGGCFLALGLFFSSLTEDQIVAAVLTFGALLFLLFVHYINTDSEWAKAFVQYASYQDHFDRMTKGVLDTRDVAYVVTFTGMFLYLSYRFLTAAQWRTQGTRAASGRRLLLLAGGIALLVAYFLLNQILPASDVAPQKWRMAVWLAGSLCVAAYVAWDWDALLDRFRTRSFQFSSLAAVQVLAVGAFAIGINYAASRHYRKWDLTNLGLYTLAPQSVQVVRSLPGEVEVAAFVKDGEPKKDKLKELLDLYAEAGPQVKVRFIDPDKEPGETRKYKIELYNTIVFTRGDQTTRVTSDTEQDVTSAFIKVSRDTARAVCFITGHGEKDSDSGEVDGFDQARQAVEGQGYETRKAALVGKRPLENCSVAVLAGPAKKPLPDQLAALKDYVASNGRLLVLVDPLPSEGLSSWLQDFGVTVHDEIVVDEKVKPVLSTLIVPPHPAHEITNKIPGIVVFSGVRPLDVSQKTPEGATVWEILKTREDTWAEKDLGKDPKPQFDKKKDRAGPLTVGVAVTWPGKTENMLRKERGEGPKQDEKASQESPAPDKDEDAAAKDKDEGGEVSDIYRPGQGRLVVLGDADFANNTHLNLEYNSDFFLNAVSWLGDELNLVNIRPKPTNKASVSLPSEPVLRATFWLPVVVGPGLILAAGIFIWLHRRRS